MNNQEDIVNRLYESYSTVIHEQQQLSSQVSAEEMASLMAAIQQADRIFVAGAGRSGLMMKAAAMRLMHLGYKVHVVGETTTPAIRQGDLLVVASGSGGTASIVTAAGKAKSVGATVAAITTAKTSALTKFTDCIVILPAAQKQAFENNVSIQYSGSLFEQAVLLMTDAIFHALWKISGLSAEEIWKSHANLE